jgi:hypothetical protein
MLKRGGEETGAKWGPGVRVAKGEGREGVQLAGRARGRWRRAAVASRCCANRRQGRHALGGPVRCGPHGPVALGRPEGIVTFLFIQIIFKRV